MSQSENERLRQIHNPDGSPLREAQLRMLDMLLYIDSVCRQEHIDYCLSDGCVIGAVRHGGFVPWDDDVDVILSKENHRRLCAYLLAHPHPQYALQSHETDPHFYGFCNRLKDTHSEYIFDRPDHKVMRYRGLQIDIFMYEPRVVMSLAAVSSQISQLNNRYIAGRCEWLAELLYRTQRHILHPIFELIGRLIGKRHIVAHNYGCGFVRTRYDASLLWPPKPIMFEGHNVQGPHNPDGYLRKQYGDYMQLPPAEQRVAHGYECKVW